MMRPTFDEVLVTGTEENLNEYIDQSGNCLVVDWRGYVNAIIDNLADLIPHAGMIHEWSDTEEDINVTNRGTCYKIGLRMVPQDRYHTIRRLNEILAGDYEIRGFFHTLGDDTHCFFVQTWCWWADMELLFPERIKNVFARITPEMDFPDYLPQTK
jgi:hypothetical protein